MLLDDPIKFIYSILAMITKTKTINNISPGTRILSASAR